MQVPPYTNPVYANRPIHPIHFQIIYTRSTRLLIGPYVLLKPIPAPPYSLRHPPLNPRIRSLRQKHKGHPHPLQTPIPDIMIDWLPYASSTTHSTSSLLLSSSSSSHLLRVFAKVFGYQNSIGLFAQIVLPCAVPWYEVIYGLTPAAYGTPGYTGGLGRINDL
ncbi:hypothetical protein F4604DRAFT_486630 [Suillus subluteus]|nr:hypothetical protein F4604DRAFT_486630 [Suillus subluteus]